MELKIECDDSVKKSINTKDINVGVPVYVPKRWFETRNSNQLSVMLLLLPKEEDVKEKTEEQKPAAQE